MSRPNILVVHLSSSYKRLVARRRSSRVAKLARKNDPLVQQMINAHESHEESLRAVRSALKERRLPSTWTGNIGEMELADVDLVVTVGGDGTVLHASHAIGATPVLAVNSSPSTSAGFFTAATAATFGRVLDEVLDGAFEPVILCRMEIQVNGEVVTRRALNDGLFCHDCPASTTRYLLTFDGRTEDQVSSGVWVSTAAGSTAAIRAAGGRAMRPRSRRLQFVVREPFPSGGAVEQRPPEITAGFIRDGDRLSIISRTEAARLYVDGPHVVFPVDFGDTVTFGRSGESLRLHGYNKKEEQFP
jgi:NAD+ kinase